MKRIGLIIVFLLAMSAIAFASGYEAEKVSGDYRVEVSIGNKPAIVGDNEVGVEIKGLQGEHVKDAEVELYYFMPSMPAMNYTAKADLKGNEYSTVVKPTMPGKWTMDVRVKRPGEELQKASFDFDAK